MRIELPAAASVSRVAWGRDSGLLPQFTDRVPVGYRIEVSLDGASWKQVTSSSDRAPTLDAIPGERLEEALQPGERERRRKLISEIDALRAEATKEKGRVSSAYIGQFAPPDPVFLLKRGDVMQRGEAVSPGGLSAVPGLPSDLGLASGADAASDPERRLALARWLGSPRNPLTPRVLVNRVWQHHFGRGIVSTPSDFGRNGDTPSHPELLDWLAAAFIAEPGAPSRPAFGWRMKGLHRLLVTSYTYRQDNRADPAAHRLDAGNRYLWRMPLRRMEAEAIRDSILAVSGKLDGTMGGPGFQLFKYRTINVAIYEPLEDYSPATWRRGIYSQAARAIRDDLLGAFDCPESSQRSPRRESTTTPLQALTMLNGPFILQQAGFMAERLQREKPGDESLQVRRAFVLAYGRQPAREELADALTLVRARGLPTLCRALLNSNEFLHF